MYDKSISCSSLTRYIDHHQQQIISEKNGIRLRQHYLRSGSNIVQTRTLLSIFRCKRYLLAGKSIVCKVYHKLLIFNLNTRCCNNLSNRRSSLLMNVCIGASDHLSLLS